MRPRTSIIWKLTKAEFQKICNQFDSLAGILRYFNLHEGAGNYRTLKRRIQEENINISHIALGNGTKGKKLRPHKPFQEWSKIFLVKGKKYSSNIHIKERLLKEKILHNKCSICGLGDKWNERPIVHVMDHINGDSSDNRIENLRIVCPNCNSQLDTFSGRNIKK